MSKRVALGLSGGVDSAVAASLLKRQGHEVHCIYLNCFDKDIPGCRSKEDRKDALAVALHLKLPFQVLDFRKQYQRSVIDYFKREYEAGRTPNPDVVCNRDIKFGLFYKWAIDKGFDYVATGHYARVARAKGQRLRDKGQKNSNSASLGPRPLALSPLSRPRDLHKDQTYFLWQVPQERFSRVLFPLGDYLKSEVREIAREAQLPVAEKKDSTGICFIGEVNVEEFLKRLGVKEQPGDVVDTSGRVIGRHRGVTFYTVGQRHGFEVNSKLKTQNSKLTDKPPLYVIEKDVEQNRLVVGFGAETYRSQFVVSQTNWLSSKVKTQTSKVKEVLVRIRHGGDLIPCEFQATSDLTSPRLRGTGTLQVALATPVRGLAAGQSAVFYSQRGVVLGGGVIQ